MTRMVFLAVMVRCGWWWEVVGGRESVQRGGRRRVADLQQLVSFRKAFSACSASLPALGNTMVILLNT